MNSKIFGERVSALRKEQGITQSQLAEKLNVSNKTISRWETGEGYPEITLLKPLATALGVTVDALLGEEYETTQGETASDKSYYNSKKEFKHKDIPVKWPGLPSLFLKNSKFTVLSSILHLSFITVFSFIMIDQSVYYKFTDESWNAAKNGSIFYGNTGDGYFFSRLIGLNWFIAMSICLIFLIVFNILCRNKNLLSRIDLFRNIAISTTLVIITLLSCSFYTGRNGYMSSSGVVIEKIFNLQKSHVLLFDFIEIKVKLIAISGIVLCSIFVISEILRIIIKRRMSEKNDSYHKKCVIFWQSLAVFNKIALVCIVVNAIFMFGVVLVTDIMGLTIASVITSYISRVGLISSGAGLAAGLLDIYDRQNKTSVIFIIINIILMYLLPVLSVLFAVTIGTAVSDTLSVIPIIEESISII